MKKMRVKFFKSFIYGTGLDDEVLRILNYYGVDYTKMKSSLYHKIENNIETKLWKRINFIFRGLRTRVEKEKL